MLEIKKYNKTYKKGFIKLINKSFEIKLKHKKELVNWKFFKNKNSNLNKMICAYGLILKNKTKTKKYTKQIIGQYSNISLEFSYLNNIIFGYKCLDMCILKDFRRKGLITKMSDKLYSNFKEKTFTIGFSNKYGIKVDKNSKKYGYKIISSLSKIYLTSFYKKRNAYEFSKISNFKELENIKLKNKLNFSKFNLFDKFIKINKDLDYIKYRYFDKPNTEKEYIFYIIKDINIKNNLNKDVFNKDHIIGYAVFKITKKTAVLMDFDFIKKGDNKIKILNKNKFINTLQNISRENKKYFMSILVLYNNFFKYFFSKYIYLKKTEELFFTLKNHNNFNKKIKNKIKNKFKNKKEFKNNLKKDNWIIMTGDIF